MAKRRKTIIAGRIRKTVLYTAPEPQDGPRARAEKSRATSAAQKAMNDKTARNRLELLLACNFEGRDLFLTLTYRDGDLPNTRKEAVVNVRRFLADMRKARRLRDVPFKYVYTTESKHGEGRLHHHVMINGTGHDIDEIRSLWPFGDVVDIEPVGSREYDQWAAYMTKESVEGRPVGAQMWTGSKGLSRPIVKSEYVTNDTALVSPPGCHVLEREEKVTEFGSYQYIKYKVPANYSDTFPKEAQGEGLVSCL